MLIELYIFRQLFLQVAALCLNLPQVMTNSALMMEILKVQYVVKVLKCKKKPKRQTVKPFTIQ